MHRCDKEKSLVLVYLRVVVVLIQCPQIHIRDVGAPSPGTLEGHGLLQCRSERPPARSRRLRLWRT